MYGSGVRLLFSGRNSSGPEPGIRLPLSLQSPGEIHVVLLPFHLVHPVKRKKKVQACWEAITTCHWSASMIALEMHYNPCYSTTNTGRTGIPDDHICTSSGDQVMDSKLVPRIGPGSRQWLEAAKELTRVNRQYRAKCKRADALLYALSIVRCEM